jgi:NNP family nitrate/nitrite transporter-like MFS transporter
VVGGAVGGPQLFTKADPVRGAITVTKSEAGIVTDVVAQRPDLVPALQVERADDGSLKNVTLAAAEGVKLFESKVERDAAGAIEAVKSTPGLRLDVKRNDAGAITDVALRSVVQKPMWLQNAAFIWVPFLVLAFLLCVFFLRSIQVPTRGFMGQFEILSSRNRARVHTWNCTMTYICSFGSFSGFSAAFPMLIKTLYGGFDGAPDPLTYAYLGPLIGGLVRMLTGGFFDKIGGSKGMQWTTVGQIAGVLFLIFGGYLTPTSLEQFSGFLYGMLWIFLMSGINNAATFRQYPIVFAYSPAKGAQMLGWTGAWAAFGPFVWNALIGTSIDKTGTVIAFFAGCALFYVYSLLINWWYYTRKGAERFDYGNAGGTWWDRLPKAEQERMKRIDLGQAA